jgi:hypothetical protein
VTTFGQVGGRELPVLGRVVQAVEEPLLLFLLGDVQEDLHDPGAVAVEVVLKGVDVRITLLPHGLGRLFARDGPSSGQELRVHPDHEDLLVVGAVEDADPPAFGQRLGGPPQEVVAELLGGGLLEGGDVAALGVHPRHHVLYGPVLAGGVHGLEHDQQAVGAVGPQQFLGCFQLVHEGLEVLLGHLLALFGLGGPEPVDRRRLGAPGAEGGRHTRSDRQLFYGGLVQFHVSLPS